MRKISPPVAIVLLVTVMLSSSCKKFIDKYFPHGPGDGGDETSCRIAAIDQGVRNGQVFYNDNGDPDSVIFDQGAGAAAYFFFWYDAQHRLIRFESDYDRDAGNYYEIHSYTYTGDQITIDSAWFRVAGEYAQVTYPEYDGVGRVVKETGHLYMTDGNPVDEDLETKLYDYGSDGNLDTFYEYDDKTSYLSTNSVWQFIERDYSKNNPAGAVGYNEHDLPLGFGDNYSIGFLLFGHPNGITWDCN